MYSRASEANRKTKREEIHKAEQSKSERKKEMTRVTEEKSKAQKTK